jgi:hypothetical protein
MNFIAVGDNHQLVVGRHAEIFDVHHLRIFTLQLQLQRFNITIAANHRVNLAGQQGAGQLEIDVNQLDALRIDMGMLRHGRQRSLLDTADRIADFFALQIGGVLMRLSRAITVFSGELISVPTRTSGSPHQRKSAPAAGR